MPDDADIAGDFIAKEEKARKAAHRAMMDSRPKVSATECEDCGEPIPEERRQKAKGCTRCIDCQRDIGPKRRSK